LGWERGLALETDKTQSRENAQETLCQPALSKVGAIVSFIANTT